MLIHLLVFGKLKTPGMRDAADHYLKNIRPWVEMIETELKPLSVPDKSDASRKRIQTKEGEVLLSKLDRIGKVPLLLLDESGRTLTTAGWAEVARAWEREKPEIALAIGSSLGFSQGVRTRASGVLSLGSQTLPHELARVVLLEQLFRAWSVLRGHPYHNEGT